MKNAPKIVIVGGGWGGCGAAEAAARAGAQVTLLERTDMLLGTGLVGGIFRNGDAPDPKSRMPGGDDLVLNMMIRLGNAMMMGSDCPEEGCPEAVYREPTGFAVCIDPGSLAEFDRVYTALAEGARKVPMPPQETFWADRFAMFTDRYGTPWMLNHPGSKCPARAPEH